MPAQFATYADLTDEAQRALNAIRALIDNVDGFTICTPGEDDTFVDEGTVDTDEAVVGFNEIIALLRSKK